MGFFGEFRTFIARGNVVDLAVGVIVGAAFGKIVTSLVDQIVMPPIGLLLGRVDFSQLKVVLETANPAARQAEVAIAYGAFINTVIQFLIIAFCVFLLVKLANMIQRKTPPEAAAATGPTTSEKLLTEIRDLLKRPAAPVTEPTAPVATPGAVPAAIPAPATRARRQATPAKRTPASPTSPKHAPAAPEATSTPAEPPTVVGPPPGKPVRRRSSAKRSAREG